jgi:putative inorganic carbon (HCO3(-)) transporter
VGHAFFLILLAAISIVAIARPWIGVVAAYCVVVLQPQAVWWWDFTGVRPALWILVPTAVGIMINLMLGRLDLGTLRNKRNLYIVVLWVCFNASYFLGPYVHVVNKWRVFDAAVVLATVNKMMLLYFMACLCIDTERKLMTLFYVVCGSVAYLVYWANAQYFFHHVVGRLPGPTDVHGQGIYKDQNDFAMMFVVAQSFFWYLGLSRKSTSLRWACWLVIPFSWNAVFLTASRGGLVGLGVTLFLIALRSRYKLFKYALIPAFLLIFLWEGGGLMKSRAETIDHYQTEGSAESRIEAWHAAAKVIVDHPLTGVGIASFIVAFPHYSTAQPREAHDTLLQITAEEGVVAGLMYLLIVVALVSSLWRMSDRMRERQLAGEMDSLYLMSEVTLIGFTGLITCSLFLSLQVFEVFYCLNLMANAVEYIDRKSGRDERSGQPGSLKVDSGRVLQAS